MSHTCGFPAMNVYIVHLLVLGAISVDDVYSTLLTACLSLVLVYYNKTGGDEFKRDGCKRFSHDLFFCAAA